MVVSPNRRGGGINTFFIVIPFTFYGFSKFIRKVFIFLICRKIVFIYIIEMKIRVSVSEILSKELEIKAAAMIAEVDFY